MKTYSLKEIAEIVHIPASTASYYRDRHKHFLPYTGSGRRKRYKPEALKAFRLIVEKANAGCSTAEIQEALKQAGPINAEIEDSNSTVQQQQQPGQIQVVNLLEKLVDQKSLLEFQNNRIESLENDLKELKEYINKNRLSWWQKLIQRGGNENH